MNNLDRKLKRLLGLARQAPPVPTDDPAPPFLARRVVRQWHRESSHSRAQRKRWHLVAAPSAAVLVLAVSLVWTLRRGALEDKPNAWVTSSELPGEDLNSLALLVSEPPVVSVHRPQVAWLAVLDQATQGDSN